MFSKHGQTTEFISLLTSHQTAIRGLIVAMLPGCQDISDVLQETNITLWEKRNAYKSGTNFKAWAYAVARIKVMQFWDQQKKQGKMVLNNELVYAIAEAHQNNSPSTHSENKLQFLNQCLAKLKPSESKIINARYNSKNGLQDLSSTLGRPTASLRVSLFRIRTKLKRCIESRLKQQQIV